MRGAAPRPRLPATDGLGEYDVTDGLQAVLFDMDGLLVDTEPLWFETEPERCVALEDSPNGVASATEAGCRVIAVPSLIPIPEAQGRLVVASLSAVSLATLRSLAS
jgi:beta-phosphoglucomutase-like phosphatase (HAD superfamily)